MAETTIKGLKAQHKIIKPTCREKGKRVAYLEAEEDIRKSYDSMVNIPDNQDANFHIVITVERP